MKKILLLGATGFIGSNIARELDRQQRPWVGIARHPKDEANPVFTLDDEVEILSVLEESPVVINALGGLKPRDFEQDLNRAMEEFWSSLQRVLGLLRKAPPAALLQISSAGTVYGEAQGRPNVESDPASPHSWYGRMKVVEEALFQQFAHDKEVIYTCARVTNPFGNEDHPTHGLVDVLIDHVLSKKLFCARFHPSACRDYIYAPEMGRALVAMADKRLPGIYNIGSGESVNLRELVQMAQNLVSEAKIVIAEPSKEDVVISSVSVRRFREEIGFTIGGPTAQEYLYDKLSQVTA
ncbi:NAD-dependent epimerase/dehydratase family protein [Billgrantia diversa]|uniref:NAD-dependent epimerase/dehydratase family protein n=1 Tax=Halomonas sp. MCCC 1A13316 TaxID=2733487 RepID=UPI0018A4622C|nr:NAD-dependent epimerase/dehydratase family protein [Halomonas sp. MCCC 1A13316]QOR37431.1 NAD-dependent epimerase/dehydratase family protein [Halomonas sp. MCCC 1A13316]